MNNMESSITDLQDELDVANQPSKKHFKPVWFLLSIIVAAVIGGGAYLATTKLEGVSTNTDSIQRACELRNEELSAVNLKFSQLVELFDASIENRPPDQPPPTAEILKLYDTFRQPIRLLDCEREAP